METNKQIIDMNLASYQKEENVAIPMSDGTTLRADIYYGACEGKNPVLLLRTPYDKSKLDPVTGFIDISVALERNYNLVIQDVRGRYSSEGDFVPYIDEGKDGFDTIEWCAQQPWSNGDVGTYGTSYCGSIQWLAALEHPPHLKAIAPVMCFSSLQNGIFYNGIFRYGWLKWIYIWLAPDSRRRKGLKGYRSVEEAHSAWEDMYPNIINNRNIPLHIPDLQDAAPYFYEWMKHPPYTKFWDFGEIRNCISSLSIPVLQISGWYDEAYAIESAIYNHQILANARSNQSYQNLQLIIGPWLHGADKTTTNSAETRKFGINSGIDYDKVILDWFDLFLKKDTIISNPSNHLNQISLYVLDADVWIKTKTYPPDSCTYLPFYLGTQEKSGEGLLSTDKELYTPFSRFLSEPQRFIESQWVLRSAGYDLSGFTQIENFLTFDTDPLSSDLILTGDITIELFISMNIPDCDIFVQILNVAPHDGSSNPIVTPGLGFQRISCRDQSQHKITKECEIIQLNFPRLFTATKIRKGNTLRLFITSSWFPSHPQKNVKGKNPTKYNEFGGDITIHHSITHPSRIIIPVISFKE